MKKSHCLFSLAAGLAVCASASAQILSFDFGATVVGQEATVNSPAGSLSGSSFTHVAPANDFTAADTAFGTLEFNMRRGLNNVDDTFVRWTAGVGTAAGIQSPLSGILAESSDVYGDYFRSGDANRALGLRLNGLDAGIYEVFFTVNPRINRNPERQVAIGVYSGAMPTDTQISDLSQTSVALWSDHNAALAEWTPSGSGSWNVLRGTVVISGATDWIVVHLEDTGNGQMGISSLQLVAIPEPSTYAALIGLLALGLVAWRRRR